MPHVLAYYEIFHDSLGSLTVDKAKNLSYESWPSRHPPMNSYFLEFVPLLGADGGVDGFDGRAARDGFIPHGGPDGELSSAEKAYIDRLLADAWSKRKLPFLSCTGSLGRARAFRKAYGGKAVLLHRNLFRQWASYCSLADAGYDFFLYTTVRDYESTTRDPFLRDIAKLLGIDGSALSRRSALFPAFILQHLYFYAIAYDHADVIVAVDEIAGDRSARQRAEQDLSVLMGCAVDLSDVTAETQPALSFEPPPRLRETVEQLAKIIPGTLMSDAAARFVDHACQDALDEWERYDFYTRRMRTLLVGKVEDTESRLATESASLAEANAEHERLVDKLLLILHDLGSEQVARTDVAGALATASTNLRDAGRTAAAKVDAHLRRISQIERELTDARSQAHAAVAARDSAVASCAEMVAECDALRDELAGAMRDRAALRQALADAEARLSETFLQRARRLASRRS